MTDLRYTRQTILQDFGPQGQDALSKAKVLVIGAGGLGCPVLQYLVAMGVGSIGIVDDDVVDITNLHRQVLYGMADIGLSKAEVAKQKLTQLNGDVEISSYLSKLDQNNAIDLIPRYDIIVDCTDNFPTRYMVNDACVLTGRVLVYGAVSGYEGQVAVFNQKQKQGGFSGNYRDLYPVMPKDNEIQNCAEAGILGVLPGIIGTMMASETIKLITNIGLPQVNKLLCYNMKYQQMMSFDYQKQQSYLGPTTEDEFLANSYDLVCVIPNTELELDQDSFESLLANGNVLCVDVRAPYEQPKITQFEHKNIVLSELHRHFKEIEKGNVIFICQSGKRSMEAVEIARAHFSEDRFYSLRGGVMNYL